MQLLGEVGNIVVGHLGRVDMVLDGVVLRGQAEGVKADGKQHIVPVHPLLPGHHIHGGVGPGVAHMEAVAGGIGELHQPIELGLVRLPRLGSEGLFLQPFLLPLLLNGGKIVFHVRHTSSVPAPQARQFHSGILYRKCRSIARASR